MTRRAGYGARRVLAAVLVAAACAVGSAAHAHDGRPAHLELVETADGAVIVRFAEPVSAAVPAHLTPRLSSGWLEAPPVAVERSSDTEVRHWRVEPPRDPLEGLSVSVDGFDPTYSEAVLVRAIFLDGHAVTAFVTARQPGIILARERAGSPRGQYLWLGLHHIALGPDHLLFVLGLVLLVRDRWRLLGTITAFTVAHSVTLTVAALGLVRLPVAAVEAVIASSLVFLAAELVHTRRGRHGLMARVPWAVALAFGLLHGFGFASTLIDVGLPAADVPMALLAFNVGVEIGQIAFVVAVLPLVAILSELVADPPAWVPLAPAYAMGTLAMFWVLERIAVAF